MKQKRFITITIIVLVLFVACTWIFSIKVHKLTLDYWIWLGCPGPLRMLDWEGYPGHDLTAVLRHENYFKKIPKPVYDNYEDVVKRFGEPLEIIYDENNADPEYKHYKAVYPDFYL